MIVAAGVPDDEARHLDGGALVPVGRQEHRFAVANPDNNTQSFIKRTKINDLPVNNNHKALL